MLTRFGHVLLIVAVLAATGSHWLLLQSVAWSTMLADNLRNASLLEAVEKTFDGKNPCCLCHEITKGKQEEKKSEFKVELKKFEFPFAQLTFVFTAPSDFILLPDSNELAAGIHAKPLLPPPRLALVV